ncbi:Ig-like domain-containing protein [Vibrio sp. MA40-2]|uniref:Ig-like domain-containing protein n=1 Tax=Vibrio sp. MA40-2 TaxID=3391828 RepID=UPI0039A58A04
MTMLKKCFGLLLLSLVSFLACASYELPTLQLTADKTEIAPGDSVILTASLEGWDEASTGVAVSELYSGISLKSKYSADTLFDNSAPYQWTIDSELEDSGETTYQAVVLFLDQVIVSSEVTITVSPSEQDIKSVSFSDGEALYLTSGDSRTIRVSGLFNDGYQRDITDVGVSYSTQTPDGGDGSLIADISSKGTLNANRHGVVDVVASYGTAQAYRRITVAKTANNNPIAGEYTLLIKANQPGNTIDVLSLASDIDGDTLDIIQFDQTSLNGGNITYDGNGIFSYSPVNGFVGTDSFSYYIGDGDDGYTEGVINIEVAQSTDDSLDVEASTSSSGGGSFGPFTLLCLMVFSFIRFKK